MTPVFSHASGARRDHTPTAGARARRVGILVVGLFALARAGVAAQRGPDAHGFEVFEATIPELQAALASGRVTSVALVDAYLARIKAYDRDGPRLNTIIRLNPKARAEAAALDRERRAGHVRGRLHGIPVILKDNYGTADLPTTAGSLALAGLVPPRDAFQVQRLREAGAIILGKANLHELASGITTISSLGGQTRNPYDPTRNPGGSSGGSAAAVAASFAAIAYGSDTCGSIRIPAAFNGLFGLRPTKGLSSISGIIPLSHTQDVAGPLARSVTDLAIGLDATVGPDPSDPATAILEGRPLPRFVAALDSGALRGARLGLLRTYVGSEPEEAEADRIVRAAVERMKALGAEIVDVDLPGIDTLAARASVINYEFKYDLSDYLARTPGAPVRSLSEILAHGLYHAALRDALRRRDTLGTRDSAPYRLALARRDTVRSAVLRLMDEKRLDALVYPTMRREAAPLGEPQTGSTCQLSASTGLPALSAPAGFTRDGLPLGVELLGRPLADARLVALAYAYEQAVHPRRPPSTTPPLVNGRAPEPVTLTIHTTGRGPGSVAGTVRYDPVRGRLDYSTRVSGVGTDAVYAVTLDRTGPGSAPAVLYRISGPGVLRATGEVALDGAERSDLVAGRVVLTLYTRAQPLGAARAPLVLPARAAARAEAPIEGNVN